MEFEPEVRKVKETPRYTADEAVGILQQDFRRHAHRKLRQLNVSLVDDLVQEMTTGVLQIRREHTLIFFWKRAVDRGTDFLRTEIYEQRRKDRYALLGHAYLVTDDTPFIEGVVDLQDQIERRFDDSRLEADFATSTERRASA